MCQGFQIGFNRNKVSLESATRNMQSAVAEPGVVDAYLAKEQEAARVVVPCPMHKGLSILAVLVSYRSLTSQDNEANC